MWRSFVLGAVLLAETYAGALAISFDRKSEPEAVPVPVPSLQLASSALPSPPGPSVPIFEIPGWQAVPGPPVVALTFDDGPHPAFTGPILDILAARQAPATFFFVGELASAHPGLVRRAIAEGHTVGGHTWTHAGLRRMDDAAFVTEVDRTDALLQSVTGRPVSCVRPPYGSLDVGAVARLAARGRATLMWNVDPWDWAKPPAGAIVERVVRQLRPGAIILLHDAGGDRSQTVLALPAILDAIRARGFRPVPLCG